MGRERDRSLVAWFNRMVDLRNGDDVGPFPLRRNEALGNERVEHVSDHLDRLVSTALKKDCGHLVWAG